MSDPQIDVKISADASTARGEISSIGDAAERAAAKVSRETDKAGKAVDSIGKSAAKSASEFSKSEDSIVASIKRATSQIENLNKTASQKIEMRIASRGLDPQKFEPALRKLREVEAAQNAVANSAGKLPSAYDEISRSFSGMVTAAAGLAAIGGSISKLVSVQREFDVMNASLITMTGSTEKAKVAFSAIQQFAATTPFALQEVAGAFTKLTSLGLTPSQRALESFGNTASAMGKSLNQFIEAVADASTGEFERLKEFGIKANKEGDSVKLTFQGITTTIRNSSDEITEYLTRIGEVEFAGAMAERAKTLDGAISNLADSWDNLFLTISQNNTGGLIFDTVSLASGAVSDLTKIINAMSSAASENAQATGAMASVQEGIGKTFETVAVLGANVAYVFRGIGTEIGGIAAQAAAVLSGDFAGAKFIGEEMRRDAAMARAEVDALSERILGARSAAVAASASLDDLAKPRQSAKTPVDSATLKAAKKEAESLSKLMDRIYGKDTGLDAGYWDDLERLNKQFKKTGDLETYRDAVAKLTMQQKFHVDAVKESEKAESEYYKALSAGDDALVKQAEKLEQEVEFYGQTETAINNTIIARLEEARAIADANGAYPEHLAYLDREIDARRRIAAASSSLDAKKENERAIKEQARAWEKFSDDIERSLTDSLFRAFEAGDSFGEAFAKSLQNTLKTTVLKLGVNFTMDLGKQLLGGALGLLTGGGSSGSGGGFGSLFSAASNASSLYGLLTGQTLNNFASMAGTASSLMAGGGAYGAAYGAGVTTTINAGAQSAQAAALAYQEASLAQAALGNAQAATELAQAAQGISAGASTTGSTLGTLGSAMQTIGLVSIPFIIGGLIDKFGGGDKYQTGVALQGVFGKDQKGGFDGIVGENYSVTSGWFHGGRDTVEWTDVDISIKDMLGILAGKASDKADGILRGKINDEQYQKALSQVGIVVGETLVKTNLEDNPLAMSKRVGKPYQEDGKTYVDIIAPVFKSAAEMTEEEIRSNWTELVDLNSWKKIDWESNVGSGYKNRLTKYGENPDYKPRDDGWDALQTGGDVLREHLERLNFDQGEYGQYLVSTNIQVYEFLSESLDKIYESTISAYRTLGEQLGATDIEAILESYTGNINIQNAIGLEQLLNGAAQQLNEGIGKAIFPIIDEIRAATGEAGTWADTFARVSGEAAAIGSAFKELGLTMHNSGIANQLLATSVALTAAFGGLEGLNAALTSYYDNYYTAEEKRARTLKQLGDALRQGGLEITDSRLGEMTRADFRSLYESIVETSGAAAPAAIAMLQMQGAFAQLTTAARESSQDLRALNARSALDEARAALERSVDAEKDRITADAEYRISALQAGIDGSMQAIDAARNSVNTLTSIFSAIENGVRRLRAAGDTAGTMLQARAYIDMSLALSKSGVVPDQAKLSDAISTVASDTSRAYASIAEFEYAQLVQASKLDALGNEIGKQKSVADMQLEALEGANRFAEEQIRAIEKSASNQIAALDSLLTQFSGQIDALNGINTSVLSVRDAVAGMNTAISGLASALNKPAPTSVSAPTSFGSSAASGGSASSSSKGGYTISGNTLIFPGGGTHTVNAGSTAASQAALISAYGLVPSGNGTYVRTRATGGYTPPGLTLVGEEGPELVNFKQPGMVYTAAQTRNLMGGADSAIAAELRALREVNARLEARLAAIEKNTRDTHDLTYRVTEGGNVMRTVAA